MGTALKEKKPVENGTSVYEVENKSTKTKLKKCFIITPIGSENSEIRRQIDGVIDACIIPTLTDFEVFVSHRIWTTGSINNQIINHIYKDDLVIANLTSLNPNVMYELAFRHAIRKPIIVIKNKNDKQDLPFDIKEDRTIFYTDDMRGTIELTENLRKYLKEIDYKKQTDNPISRAITDLKTRELLGIEAETKGVSLDVTNYLLKRLDEIENKIVSSSLKPTKFVSNDRIQNYEYNRLIADLDYLLQKIELSSGNDKKKLFEIERKIVDIKDRYKKLENFISEEDEEQFFLKLFYAESNLEEKSNHVIKS